MERKSLFFLVAQLFSRQSFSGGSTISPSKLALKVSAKLAHFCHSAIVSRVHKMTEISMGCWTSTVHIWIAEISCRSLLFFTNANCGRAFQPWPKRHLFDVLLHKLIRFFKNVFVHNTHQWSLSGFRIVRGSYLSSKEPLRLGGSIYLDSFGKGVDPRSLDVTVFGRKNLVRLGCCDIRHLTQQVDIWDFLSGRPGAVSEHSPVSV